MVTSPIPSFATLDREKRLKDELRVVISILHPVSRTDSGFTSHEKANETLCGPDWERLKRDSAQVEWLCNLT